MPIRPDLTHDDIVRIIARTAVGPRRAREAGLANDTEAQRNNEIGHSNACVFVLMALGLEHDEIRDIFSKVERE